MKKEKLDILYKDKYFIAVNKKSSLLTIKTNNKEEKNLYSEVSNFVKKEDKNNKIFIIHRLDKDTSGIVLFARNEKIKKQMQDSWENVKRSYLAICYGITPQKKHLEDYLLETKTFMTYVTKDKKQGKLAITDFEKIKNNQKYSLLNINILTGRKNQIRVQLKNAGFPLVGDKKYNINDHKRLMLHANKLEFIHPITKKTIIIESSIPKDFLII